MYPVRSTCPVCGEQMVVTRMSCQHCSSELSGSFDLPLLLRLNAEQMQFVEVMLKNRGNIQKVSADLGIPYPMGRAKLDEIIAALGFDVESEETPSISGEERQRILKALEEGKLSTEQALRKLKGQG